MAGVTAAIVAFIFLSLAFPTLIKDKTQFYAALLLVVIVIFLDALGHAFTGISGFTYFIGALFQIGAIVMLVLASGGLTIRDFGREVGDAADAMIQGESRKQIVLPLSAAAMKRPNPADLPPQRRKESEPETDAPTVYTLDDTPSAPPAEPSEPAKQPDHGPLPLE